MEKIEKLINIQNEIRAPKSQWNNFGRYNYRNAEDILQAFKPLGKKYGCMINLTDDLIYIGDRFYVKSTAKIIDLDGSLISESISMAREPENKKGTDQSQVTGGSSSYARKYALNGLLALDDNKDADHYDNRSEVSENEKKQVSNKKTNTKAEKKQESSKKADNNNNNQNQKVDYTEMIDKLKEIKAKDFLVDIKYLNENQDIDNLNQKQLSEINSRFSGLIKKVEVFNNVK